MRNTLVPSARGLTLNELGVVFDRAIEMIRSAFLRLQVSVWTLTVARSMGPSLPCLTAQTGIPMSPPRSCVADCVRQGHWCPLLERVSRPKVAADEFGNVNHAGWFPPRSCNKVKMLHEEVAQSTPGLPSLEVNSITSGQMKEPGSTHTGKSLINASKVLVAEIASLALSPYLYLEE
jgi:hypothetical protein